MKSTGHIELRAGSECNAIRIDKKKFGLLPAAGTSASNP